METIIAPELEQERAVAAFAALAHPHRLSVFQILVKAAPGGLAAGEIARRLNLPASSLSFHLSHLSASGLITSRRKARSIIYSVNFAVLRSVLAFLLSDCCGGAPRQCSALLDAVAPADGPPERHFA